MSIHYALEHVFQALDIMGNPHLDLKNVIHIAGTNGKGSVTAFLKEALEGLGYVVGTYTSPHLFSYCERFYVTASSRDLGFILQEDLELGLKNLDETMKTARIILTEFERLTVVAFLWFKEKKPDYILLETGLGGRCDATNIILKPLLTLITRISYDHQDILGKTLSEIAYEKSGIMKEGVPVLTPNTQNIEVMDVLKRRASLMSSPFLSTENFEKPLEAFRLSASYQRENLGIVLESLRYLFGKDIIERSLPFLKKAYHPRRFEIIEKNGQTIVLDAAHNPNGVSALLSALRVRFPNRKFCFCLGILKRKEAEKMLMLIRPFSEKIYLCCFDENEAVGIADLGGHKGEIEAVKLEEISSISSDFLVITGSIYFLGLISIKKDVL